MKGVELNQNNREHILKTTKNTKILYLIPTKATIYQKNIRQPGKCLMLHTNQLRDIDSTKLLYLG